VIPCQQPAHGEKHGPGEASVRHTSAVKTVLTAATTPVTVEDLSRKLSAEYPDAPTEAIETLLAELVTPLDQAAEQVPTDPVDLAEAVEVYRAAGRAALESQARARSWFQFRIQFADWNAAEQGAAAHLAPRLQDVQEKGTLPDWWFLRKHPYWRL
jgi:hypothetical protein